MSTEIHPYAYYNCSKLKWTDEESQQLHKLYHEDLLNVLECANILKRTPGCISYKLKSMGIITHNTLARGYAAYKKSPLYIEIVNICKKEKDESNRGSKQTISTPHPLSIAEQLNAKEAHLLEEVEFYKSNMEQLVRIHTLEIELEKLKASVKDLYAQQSHKDYLLKEIVLPCREHIQKVFPALMTLWKYGNQKKVTEPIQLPKLSNGQNPGRVIYTIEPNNDETIIKCIARGTRVDELLSGIWNGTELVFNE